jgi:cysteine synthase A
MKDQPHPLPSIIEAIAWTPLVELTRFSAVENARGRILLKLEYLLPGFSKKDRIARRMIEEAEASGELTPGKCVVELTSGNTGTGLAVVCAVKGYPFVAVMSRGNSRERARMMKALGAEVVLVDQAPGSVAGEVSGADLERVEAMTRRIVAERNAFRADQFRLPGNPAAHRLHTGPEIIQQTGGNIDGFCDFAGTGGTFAGVAAALKAHKNDIRCYLIEPEGAAALKGEPVTRPNHRIQGGGYAMPSLPLIDESHLDGHLTVSDEAAVETARRLAKTEGVFAGFSTGANVAGALQLLRGPLKGKTVVTLACDSGLKYLSTTLWEDG